MTALAERLGVPPHPATDLTALPDWQAADILNAPDPSLPLGPLTLERTVVGPAEIMRALGPEPGAGFLNALEEAGVLNRVIFWGFYELKAGGLDVADATVRQQLLNLAAAGLLSLEQATILLTLAERRKVQSWAEFHGIEISARLVGEARKTAP